ncbi:helix-turn-helix domain-containing protein [Stenotrophomonas sp. GD03680]|uniref:helix-turn-helix domain-containing protein n=1 Tax=Stenotrophomonas sp. GD03680 TaxID=2975365 RepID=UPI0024488D68|nr:helix-turn-helix domain-containing protein [Stenotrophomonas sp. GD03680]MDH2022921.1 helix-turn-helix domain-containing protein [Stenotrophomonas sp. GD03680]
MTTSGIKPGFPERLREARERGGLTLRELGELVGINYSQISRYEQGIALPRPGVLVRLAEALAMPLEHLRDGEEVRIIELVAGDEDVAFARVGLSSQEFKEFQRAAEHAGLTLEEAVTEVIRLGIAAQKSVEQDPSDDHQ